jgi:hypothetical protein
MVDFVGKWERRWLNLSARFAIVSVTALNVTNVAFMAVYSYFCVKGWCLVSPNTEAPSPCTKEESSSSSTSTLVTPCTKARPGKLPSPSLSARCATHARGKVDNVSISWTRVGPFLPFMKVPHALHVRAAATPHNVNTCFTAPFLFRWVLPTATSSTLARAHARLVTG